MIAQMITKINISAANPSTAPKIQKILWSKLGEVEVPHAFICIIDTRRERKFDEQVRQISELL